MSKSWKPEVRTGTDPKFYGNNLAFATKEEAEFSARDLMNRWMLVVECRAVESDQPVNYRINENMVLEEVKAEEDEAFVERMTRAFPHLGEET